MLPKPGRSGNMVAGNHPKYLCLDGLQGDKCRITELEQKYMDTFAKYDPTKDLYL